MVQTAHRFGIRVYFDNVMNHRASHGAGLSGFRHADQLLSRPDSGGFSSADGFRRLSKLAIRWRSLLVHHFGRAESAAAGSVDLAQEPGTVNWNFGNSIGNTATKPVFVRFPNRPDLYMDTNGPLLGAGWGGSGWHGRSTAPTASRWRRMFRLISAARWRGRFTRPSATVSGSTR